MDKNKQYVYTIYDKVAGMFGPLFEAVNDGVAIRQFRQIIRNVDPDSKGDFVLRVIGLFDHGEEGQFSICEEREIPIPKLPAPEEVQGQVINAQQLFNRKNLNRGM